MSRKAHTTAERVSAWLMLGAISASTVYSAPGFAQTFAMRSTTSAQRQAARANQAPTSKKVTARYAGINTATASQSSLLAAPATTTTAAKTAATAGTTTTTVAPLAAAAAAAPTTLATMAAPMSTPDYFAIPNYANSPLPQLDINGAVIAGTGMRKFVDTLPGLCAVSGANNLGQCLPLATADTTSFPGSDYYKIGLVEYTKQLHSDLPPTKMRGYKDLASGSYAMQYLGPIIVATRNRPVRVLFQNSLTQDMPIPVDTTYMGAGVISDGARTEMASQKRANLHLHGGNTPWISDGTTHQWITPFGDAVSAALGFSKGFSFANVPDMIGAGKPIPSPSLGDGLASYFWTNEQSGRLMFYHDHAYGITRLNVYSGTAAGYLLTDPVQEAGLETAGVPGTIVTNAATGGIVRADLAHFLPLVIQDKSFVPDNGEPGGQLAATDPTWDVATNGGKGSLWWPHVYTPNQNPYDVSGANPFGRWDYGPWFWPPQPSTVAPISCTSTAYPGQILTCPGTPNPSGTPESFMDTPLVNGTAYPTMEVDPTAYRMHLLTAGNDRTLNLSWFVAVDANGNLCDGTTTPVAGASGVACTEVKMVPAVPATARTIPDCAIPLQMDAGGLAIGALDANGLPLNGTGLQPGCWPTYAGGAGAVAWPTEGRDGGVPDPTTAGPAFIQIGTEGGLLPAPVVIPATAVSYDYNRRSVTVLNVLNHGMYLGPAERADVVVDFSKFAGKTLILYNDGPAPVPAGDPRVDYYTGNPDQTTTGGAPSTIAGYGPNTRTIMQVKVRAAGATAPFNLPALATAQPALFAATQDPIIVPEPAYPPANGGSPTGNYGRISDNFMSWWNGGGISSLTLAAPGSGYTAPVTVAITGGGGSGATATATVGAVTLASLSLVSGGSGYSTTPVVNISGGGGTGATGSATLSATGSVASVTLTSGGTGYTSAPTITFTGGGGSGATATAALSGGAPVASIAVSAAGTGYTAPPTVSFTGGGGTGATGTAVLATAGSIKTATLSAGGTGYLTAPTVAINGGGGTGATATATLGGAAGVGTLALTAGGSGYTTPPTVTLSGGGGTGATATATLSASGSVKSITIVAGGSGYRAAPIVNITGGGGTGATAVAAVQAGGTRRVTGVTVTAGGTGYTSAPSISFTPTNGGSGATATSAVGRAVASLNLTAVGTNYTSAPTVAISGGGGTGATGTATVGGRPVVGITLTNGGSGYTSNPTVTFTPTSGGSGAAATVTRGFGIASVTVTAAGSGYTTAPTIAFTGGNGSGAAATATLGGKSVGSITLTAGGTGYTSVPTVGIAGGGGTGAAATATVAKTVASVKLTTAGAGYTSVPSVTISGGGGTGATATAILGGGPITSITLTNPGIDFTSAPTITITGGAGTGAVVTAKGPSSALLPKTIQELFTLDYSRMNALLGTELPFTSALIQTTLPYGYADPPTEIIKDGETQLWKITHNGVDTHFIHFHLFTVQVVNRVGWDGAIKPPDPNELSWKDTVRMNPLEDIIVAAKPVKQTLPFTLPNSYRPIDPTQPVGSSLPGEFLNVDPTNQPATVINDIINFGWEYVWHCHILGHEENDMMRAIAFVVAPQPATALTATGVRTGATDTVNLSWTKPTVVDRTGFTVERATAAAGPWTAIGTTTANVSTFANTAVPRNTTYYYRVTANNLVGYTRAYAAPAAGYPKAQSDSAPTATTTITTP